MAEAKVIFSLELNEITIQCSPEDKMRDICQKFATEAGMNINLLTFLYGDNQLNMELKFKEANQNGGANNEMKINVIKRGTVPFICPNCGEKIKLDTEKIDEIISSNSSINDSIIEIKSMIENIIKMSSVNNFNTKLKHVNILLNNINEDLKNNNNKLKNLLNDDESLSIKINNNIYLENKNVIEAIVEINIDENDNNIMLFNADVNDGIDVYYNNEKIDMLDDNGNMIINYDFKKSGKYKFTIVFDNDITNLGGFFEGCSDIISLDFSNFNTENVFNMSGLFNSCNKLKIIKGMNKFITDKVINMRSMFQGCKELEYLDLSSFNTENVTDMGWMFNKCYKLKEIKGINKFITNKLTNMKIMFANCNQLEYIDLSSFNTENVTDISCMFSECHKLKEIKGLNQFNTDKVKNIYGIFNECYELEYLDLSNFNTENVTDILILRMLLICHGCLMNAKS